ncbi:UV-endonuclease UVE-1 [Aspergillus undulatus]|uniref:UV-endonuclease UVE-1 n=1 Tax=Aspergillus undulatus TaxID=1810928 RepID=UPI003CCE2069
MFMQRLPPQRFVEHAARFHSAAESGPARFCHTSAALRSWMTRLVSVAIPIAAARKPDSQPQFRAYSVATTTTATPSLHSSPSRSPFKLATTQLAATPSVRLSTRSLSLSHAMAGTPAPVTPLNGAPIEPESDDGVPVEAEELQEALSRAPPVNSSYLPLPWKGRLGYACLNTYLRYSNPPVFCSRTCRIASILENRHPLADPSQPPHPTKNRPDQSQPADIARGQAYVEALGLANARDLLKLIRWNDRYGIKFMRLSSEMFPFASHKEYGYRLASFASGTLGEVGRLVAELGHRVSVHPGQFTQLGSPRKEVFENSVRDLEYHSELLQLLKLPPQQDRDAVMILHMGGAFGDKEATLGRFRENYKTLSQDIKNRLVLENDDVSWSVHDLLPICEELNIPLVLDYHHHNIIFDSSQVREGTLDIMNFYDRIKATWTRKNITQKMHYSEPVSAAITNRQRRKHSDRVRTLPPCDPTMDLMIEAKDKEQAVFELMRTFKLPGHDLINDILPYVRNDENKPFKAPRKSKKNGDFVDIESQAPPSKTVPEEEVGMGGPERRVYWPPGMEEWLRPKKIVRTKALKTPKSSKKAPPPPPPDVDGEIDVPATPTSPTSKSTKGVKRTSSVKKTTSRKRKASPTPETPSASDIEPSEEKSPDEKPPTSRVKTTGTRRGRRTKAINYAEDSDSPNLASRPPLRNRWRPPPTSPVKWPVPPRPLPHPRRFPSQELRPNRGNLSRLFRFFFGPYAGRRTKLRLWSFRHETIPAIRHRAQARVYRALVQRQTILAKQTKTQDRRLGLTDLLVGRRRRRRRGVSGLVGGLLVPFEKEARAAGKKGSASGGGKGPASMSDYGPSSSSTWSSGYGYGGRREPGARRKKVFEYLKAANELRQSYAASWTTQRNASRDLGDEYMNTSGAFPDVEIARSGDEEMLIFPSYARRLDRDRMAEMREQRRRDSTDTVDEYHGLDGAQDHDISEWDTFDDENAVVAVDVRGWVYAPYRGPMTRKQRLVVALARRLSGVPAPTNNDTGLDGTSQEEQYLPRMTEKREEELVDTEAQSIIQNADKGNELNWKEASEALEGDAGRGIQRAPTSASMQSTQSTQLSKDELSVANAHLMERIRPFLSSPMAGMAVTVFFFNDENSQSRNIMTNYSGHFSIRASLSFEPTHIRVLASEDLSAVKEIEIIEPKGVSMISDIDDTVKHSAIANGAKEMCKNVFIRELSDLTIEGVTDWYTEMAKLGVQIHYVSNAPWQLYPLLDRFWKMQYSGMLQGIFEPTMERKKGALEQILQDFPDRQFILVGDSGEADLEVYTDLVMANPGRIIGIFIRDITTPERTHFFEKSINHLEHNASRNRSNAGLVDRSDSAPNRPTLPPRPPRADSIAETKPAETEDLIDLSEEPEKSLKTPPTVPSKPSSLRSVTNSADIADRPPVRGPIQRKPAPPLPRRSGGGSGSLSPGEPASGRSSPATRSDSSINSKELPVHSRPSPIGGDGAWASKQKPAPPPPRRSNTGASTMSSSSQSSANTARPISDRQPRFPTSSTTPASRSSSPGCFTYPPPPRILRSPASNPSLSSRTSANPDSYPPSRTSMANSSGPPRAPLPNKREELWRRRWERASEILADKGVVLGSWRVGKDVQDVSIWLVKEALKESTPKKDKIKEKEREVEREKERNQGAVWGS